MARLRDPIGGMQRRLRFEQNSPVSKNAAGEWVERWVSVLNTPDASVWAEIEDFSGREFFNAAQVQADVDCRIRIHATPGTPITPDMRAVDVHDAETVYEIVSVVWIDRRTKHEILARRLVTNPRA